jgi:hypothetical protein
MKREYDTVDKFCINYDFNTEPSSFSTQPNPPPIPLLETIPTNKQIVFGRVRNLADYYNDKTKFITLNTPFWDVPNLYFNDMYVECAINNLKKFNHEANKFIIRIVLTDNLFAEKEEGKTIPPYDTDNTKSSVLSRELCQFMKYSDINIIQSITNPNILFVIPKDIDNFDKLKYRIIFNKVTVPIDYTFNNYKNKYIKYKQKYLALKYNS